LGNYSTLLIMTDLSPYIKQVADRLNLSTVIARDIKLTRKGREFSGLCPFHHEKSPSFTVNDQKGFFYCFGCGEKGDVFAYVMKRQNVDFKTALYDLAVEAGVKIIEENSIQDKKSHKLREDLYGVVAFCHRWFQDQLLKNYAEGARDYLNARGFLKSLQTEFGLGFAPDPRKVITRLSDGTSIGVSLLAALKSQGFPHDLILRSGVVIEDPNTGKLYDRFRDRIMFPIHDAKGKVIAFGGRVFESPSERDFRDPNNISPHNNPSKAKYINSSETPIFHKGQVLYNYHQASKNLKGDSPLIVVEGYFDVIAMHKVGIKTAVAPLGTAITERQLELLWKRCEKPILCFDGDNAGLRAGFRALERALPLIGVQKTLSLCYLPFGEDPDSIISGGGKNTGEDGGVRMQKALGESLPIVDSLWNFLIKQNPLQSLTTPESKAKFKKTAMDIIKVIKDPEIRRFYEVEFNERLNNSFQKMREAYYGLGKHNPEPYGHRVGGAGNPMVNKASHFNRYGKSQAEREFMAPALKAPPKPQKKKTLAMQMLLAILIKHPKLIKDVYEEFVNLDFQNQNWENVKIIMLTFENESCGHNSTAGEDSTKLMQLFAQAGFDNEVKNILYNASGLIGGSLFAKNKDSSPFEKEKEMLKLWQDIWQQTAWRQEVENDIKAAQQEARKSFDPELWRKIKVLKNLNTQKTLD